MEITYTFIIPHHNSPELLNRCLDSIPQREDIQVIVVDDNSCEDKRPNVKRQDVEIIYIDAEHTKGAGHARNIGMAQAKGKWLLFPDCDDYYSTDLLSVLDSYCDKEIDVLYFNYHHYDGITESNLPDNKLQLCIQNYSGDPSDCEYIKYRNNTPWTKMLRRVYVEQHKMYYEEVPNGNDVLFSLFVASYTDNFAISNARLYTYVKTPNSIATSKQDKKKILCRVTHMVKHNCFNKFIGHSEWKFFIFKYICVLVLRMTIVESVTIIPAILLKMPFLLLNRKEWVKIILDHK